MDRTETIIFEIKNNYDLLVKGRRFDPDVEFQVLTYHTIKTCVFRHNYQLDAYLLDEIIELCDDFLNERVTND